MQRIELQSAYVVHARAYRDTSLLVDFLTPEYGRVSAVVRGVHSKKSPKRNLLNPFIPLLISLQGKGSLKLLTHLEPSGRSHSLVGTALFSGLYLNELISRLLPEWDAHAAVYHDYVAALSALCQQGSVEPVLRQFETLMLQELGYGIDWHSDAINGSELDPLGFYRLDVNQGFIAVAEPAGKSFLGADLLAAGLGDFTREETRRTAKQINRLLLQPLLGDRPLRSRELFAGLVGPSV